MTTWTNPRARPSLRKTEVSPHIPGFFRPQFKQTSSLTPTSLPQEGQRMEPVRLLWNMAVLYPTQATATPHTCIGASVGSGSRRAGSSSGVLPGSSIGGCSWGSSSGSFSGSSRAGSSTGSLGSRSRRGSWGSQAAWISGSLKAAPPGLDYSKDRAETPVSARRGPRSCTSPTAMAPPDSSQWILQLVWLVTLAIPIACVAWTVTHEEVFREPREYCAEKSKSARSLLARKFFYLFTCEYCFSHYVTIFVLVAVANIYMSSFSRLRQEVKSEKLTAQKKEIELEEASNGAA